MFPRRLPAVHALRTKPASIPFLIPPVASPSPSSSALSALSSASTSRPSINQHHLSTLNPLPHRPSHLDTNPSPIQSKPDYHDPNPLRLPDSIDRTLNSIADPFQLLASELTHIKQNLKALVGSHHPKLDSIAKYYFSSAHQGKHLRPIIILLISQATSESNSYQSNHQHQNPPVRLDDHDHDQQNLSINLPISSLEILNDINPDQPILTTKSSLERTNNILPNQCRLAEIAELIHVSSLLHDDVIDQADSRRGSPSSPHVFGSKLSVLAGDFLLARASVALSRLGNLEVIELISSIISNLVEGELMQLESILRPNSSSQLDRSSSSKTTSEIDTSLESKDSIMINNFNPKLFEFYERKNYLKTASLIAKTCRATVLLSPFVNQNQSLIESSYRFGKHLGLAFQIVDDILDYTSNEELMGKNSQSSDLKSGLITGPGLFAWMKFDDRFGELVNRKFSSMGDLDLAQKMIKESNGIESSYDLAKDHIRICKFELDRNFKDSESKHGLMNLCDLVLQRTH